MVVINKTSSITCRFLNEDCLAELHKTFLESFSDYVVPFQLTEEQLHKHILNNAIDLNFSVGAFAAKDSGDSGDSREMIGFTLNGFGMWNGRSTAYDAGTGVIPDFRRRGASRAMFEFMLPVLQGRGVEQLLLEVVTTNDKAVGLYRSLGFEATRELLTLKAAYPVKLEGERPEGVTVREISRLEWGLFQTFWDGKPTWQNSPESVNRTLDLRNILGVFTGGRCAGYIIFTKSTGNIVQIAIDKNHRNRGFGSLLLAEAQALLDEEKTLQVINLDESLTDTVKFLQNWGFAEVLRQYEMIKIL